MYSHCINERQISLLNRMIATKPENMTSMKELEHNVTLNNTFVFEKYCHTIITTTIKHKSNEITTINELYSTPYIPLPY